MLGARLGTDPDNPSNPVLRTWQNDSLWQTGGYWSRVQAEFRGADFAEVYHRIWVRIGGEAAVVNHTDWWIWAMVPIELRPSVDPSDHSLSPRFTKNSADDLLTWAVHRRIPSGSTMHRTEVPVDFDRWIQVDFYAKAGADAESGRIFLAIDRQVLVDEQVATVVGGGTWEKLQPFKVYGNLIDVVTDPEVGNQNQVQVWFDDAAFYDHFAAVEAPDIDPPGGTFTGDQTITLTSATATAHIHYTLDGSTPDSSSPSVANGESITLSADAQLRTVALADGLLDSAIATADFDISAAHRAITIESFPDHVWSCDPPGTRNEQDGMTTFKDLNAEMDHLLESKPSEDS